MSDVLIVVEGELDASSELVLDHPLTRQAIAALQQAILTEKPASQASLLDRSNTQVSVLPNRAVQDYPLPSLVLALTLDLPDVPLFRPWLAPEHLYQVCRRVEPLRQVVFQQLNYPIGSGEFWLPIVYTGKGPLYAEVIGRSPQVNSNHPLEYYQPLHLNDRWRQLLYRLGQRLLKLLQAPPAVYLLQFGFQDQNVCFDRLYPFPASPAIASLQMQTPDLFASHWRCLTGQPVRDLKINTDTYQLLPTS